MLKPWRAYLKYTVAAIGLALLFLAVDVLVSRRLLSAEALAAATTGGVRLSGLIAMVCTLGVAIWAVWAGLLPHPQKSRRALAQIRQRDRLLFDAMLDGYALHEIITDAAARPVDYRFLDINPRFEKFTGLSRDIIGKTVLEVLPGTEPHWIETYGQVALTGNPVSFEDYSGAVGGKWFEVVALRPAPRQFATIFHDITSRKHAEEALRASEERYRTFVEHLQGIAFHGRPNFVPTFLHGIVEEITGYTPAEILAGNPAWSALIHPDDLPAYMENVNRRVFSEPGFKAVTEYRLVRKDGQVRWVSEIIQNLPGPPGVVDDVHGLVQDITARKRSEAEAARLLQQVREHGKKLRALTIRLAEVEEAERRRLAQELHDQVGQNLTALGLNLNIARSQLPNTINHGVFMRLDDSLKLVEETTERIRNVMANLRPPVLDDYGLAAALCWYGARFTSLTGIPVNIIGPEPEPRPSTAVENALFRISQEALANVAKHARATQVTINISCPPLRLEIVDNGHGFDPAGRTAASRQQGWGLLTMSERAMAVGADFTMRTAPGQGVCIAVEVTA
jgi:PAS domain S-box-containing protein